MAYALKEGRDMSMHVHNGRPDFGYYAIVMLAAIFLAIHVHGVLQQ